MCDPWTSRLHRVRATETLSGSGTLPRRGAFRQTQVYSRSSRLLRLVVSLVDSGPHFRSKSCVDAQGWQGTTEEGCKRFRVLGASINCGVSVLTLVSDLTAALRKQKACPLLERLPATLRSSRCVSFSEANIWDWRTLFRRFAALTRMRRRLSPRRLETKRFGTRVCDRSGNLWKSESALS
jgi:hypothetical protein